MKSNQLSVFLFGICLVFGALFLQANAYKYVNHDFDVAASEIKHTLVKSVLTGHHDHLGEEKGEKDEKGYEIKNA